MHVVYMCVCVCVCVCVCACVMITVCVKPVLRGARMPLQSSKTVTGIRQAGKRPNIMKGTKRRQKRRAEVNKVSHGIDALVGKHVRALTS